MSRRRALPLLLVAGAAALIQGCGGTPSGPSPSPGPQPPPVVTPNQPPVIAAVQASVMRAEVDTDIALTATVTDAETPISQLQFAWSADAGTFAGTGPTVTWRVPASATTPKDYVATLTVTETYGTADASGVRPTHKVTAQSPPVRVHNSPREVGDLSLGFLLKFATSSIDAATAVRDFSDNCRGKADERDDIENNRRDYEILASSLKLTTVKVAASYLTADATVACSFTSRRKACGAGEPGCVVGAVGTVAGDCALTAVYEKDRWWLCTSNFVNGRVVPVGFRSFMSSRDR